MASPTSQDTLTPPTPSTPEHTMSVTPKLRLCVKRKDGHYVPLVAVDELPTWIKLKGVPMKLPQDAFDRGWANCGYQPRTNDEYYQVELHGIPADILPCNVLKEHEADESSTSQNSSTEDGKVFMAPDKNGEGSKTSSDSMRKEKAHIKGIQVFPSSPGQCIILNLKQAKFAGLKMHPRLPVIKQGTSGTLGRKIYCSYWLRTGNCNYEQQGCKYRHEIPSDEETRNIIGFRDCPNWWSMPPTQPPTAAKAFQVDRTHQAIWRRGMTQDDHRELPASLTHGHYRASSNIAAPVPQYDLVQRPSIIQAPIVAPTSTDGRASDARALDLHKLQAAQQAALFLPQQQVSQDLHQMQLNSFDGANGNTSFQPIAPTHQRTERSQPPTNELFGNAKVVGTIERHPVPATQPPISRPVFQDFETYLKGKDTTKPIRYTPSQHTVEATPQPIAPADSNTTTSTHTMKANQKAFSINGSVHSTSHARTPATSGANKAASDVGSLSSLMNGSIASPRVMHRRMFVPPGEPQYMPNPIAPGKARQRSHSNKRANGRGRGCGAGRAGQSGRAPKAQVQAAHEEDLVLL